MTSPDQVAGIAGGTSEEAWDDPAQDALNRMRRAYERGTGCHLTREMIQSFGLTMLSEMWSADDPRAALLAAEKAK